jgi:hypothetical protein
LLGEARPRLIQGVDLKPNFWILLEMTISQSKIGEIKKSLPGGAGQRDLSKNAIKKGHGLKTVV